MKSFETMVGLVGVVEKMLELAIVSKKPISPIAQVIRTALIREIALADQIIAALRDGAMLVDCKDLYYKLKRNHRIVCDGFSQLKG